MLFDWLLVGRSLAVHIRRHATMDGYCRDLQSSISADGALCLRS
jgi:hypothetical protein